MFDVSCFNFSIFKLLRIYRMIIDNRANKRNTFRPGNLFIVSAALLLMMVHSMTSTRLLVTIRKVTFGSEPILE